MEIVKAFLVVCEATALGIAPFSQAAEAGAQGEAIQGRPGLGVESKVKVEKKVQSRPDAEAKPREVLAAGDAVVLATRLNVRGQARLKSEIVGLLTNGEPVKVLEVINLQHAGPEEPPAWAKIALPASIHPWVSAHFVDTANKTVTATRLNLRGGPGQNYSVLGLLRRGDPVRELSRRGDWLEIETPATAYAFVAAQFLKSGALPGLTAAARTPTAPEMTTNSATVASTSLTPLAATPTVSSSATATATTAVPVQATPLETNAAPGTAEAATNSATAAAPTAVAAPTETPAATNSAGATLTADAAVASPPPETNAAPGTAEAATNSTTAAAPTAVTAPKETPAATNSAGATLTADAALASTPPETNAAPGTTEAATNTAAVSAPTAVISPAEAAAVTHSAAATPSAAAPVSGAPPETSAASSTADAATNSGILTPLTTVTLPQETAAVTNPPAATPTAVVAAAAVPSETNPLVMKLEQPSATTSEPAKVAPKADTESERPTTNLPTAAPSQAPPLPISANKQARLRELTEKYKGDQITPGEYHRQRAKILAEP